MSGSWYLSSSSLSCSKTLWSVWLMLSLLVFSFFFESCRPIEFLFFFDRLAVFFIELILFLFTPDCYIFISVNFWEVLTGVFPWSVVNDPCLLIFIPKLIVNFYGDGEFRSCSNRIGAEPDLVWSCTMCLQCGSSFAFKIKFDPNSRESSLTGCKFLIFCRSGVIDCDDS